MAFIIQTGASSYTATNPNGELLVAITGTAGDVTLRYPGVTAPTILSATAPNAADSHRIVLTQGTTVTTLTTNVAHIDTTPSSETGL